MSLPWNRSWNLNSHTTRNDIVKNENDGRKRYLVKMTVVADHDQIMGITNAEVVKDLLEDMIHDSGIDNCCRVKIEILPDESDDSHS